MNTEGKGNGQASTPEEIAVQHAVQHHVASYQRIVAERDELQKQLNKMEQMQTISKIEIEELRAREAAFQSRMESYQQERDTAVSERAAYEMLFATISAQLRVFKLPAVPLITGVKETDEANPPRTTVPSPAAVSAGRRPGPTLLDKGTSQKEVRG